MGLSGEVHSKDSTQFARASILEPANLFASGKVRTAGPATAPQHATGETSTTSLFRLRNLFRSLQALAAMTETIRNEIVRLHYTGASQRAIARLLDLHRKSVFRVFKKQKDPLRVRRRRSAG